MTIDGTNISTVGLRLASIDGYYNLPENKPILPYKSVSTSLTIDTEKTVNVSLIGKYDTTADLIQAISDFDTMILAKVIHDIVFVGHDETFKAVAKNGYKTVIHDHGYRMLEIQIALTITTLV